jgi:hypothetical protein
MNGFAFTTHNPEALLWLEEDCIGFVITINISKNSDIFLASAIDKTLAILLPFAVFTIIAEEFIFAITIIILTDRELFWAGKRFKAVPALGSEISPQPPGFKSQGTGHAQKSRRISPPASLISSAMNYSALK